MELKLSFCITCKNRFHQVSKTLLKNLSDNKELSNEIEFVLVDFDSDDNLKEWVFLNFKEELKTGYLKYFFSDKLPKWHCSVAKNLAHKYSNGKILVNLDCDNYVGQDGAKFVLAQFDRYGEQLLLHQASGVLKDGSFGRIAVLAKYFQAVGGYDETFHPMGYQDADLIHRLVKFGLKYISKGNLKFNLAIPNSKEEGIKFTESEKTYFQMNAENNQKSKFNIMRNKIKANQ